ncbi:ABC transporter ATP-binding protein/permease [Haploplasma axanthum]|uniref:ABC transporter ATPase n=1 Tax=Haploplasma axanthum TaxID=29552 RepID=A0A449BD77_HAPAX|nr:ATP-binding cassette domain-containing protein [Haploplasma axanthum]VEU80385.1 ABC transporter ATPase [Haploplasma axanthum]
MIKLINVDKYFNKGKQNSIHVINNTSLELPEKGLVTLLGSSGSGKSTLLNVIGGLDKAQGTIIFNDITINKYKSSIWDQIRAEKIGFIFQNYHLLETQTIYENIADSLRMIGITDKDEIEYRVNYVLNAVGMLRFKKKLASDLSGGQKQRVAIARAIVKNPDVIIADEPTGNLDSKNSIDVLKIIKEISKEKLVVLVTHNVELANHYSDRIINITDGSVQSDVENSSGKTHINQTDDNIYLQDYKKNQYDNIDIYSNEDVNDFGLIIIKENGKYYIKSKNNVKLEVLDNSSRIKVIDRKREDVLKEELEKVNFSIDELSKHETKRTKARFFSITDSIKIGFNKLRKKGFKRFVKITMLLLIGMMFSLGVNLLINGLIVDKSKITVDKNVYTTNNNFDYQRPNNYKGVTEYLDSDDFIVYKKFDYIYIGIGNNRYNRVQLNVLPSEILKDKIKMYDENKIYIDSSALKGTTAEQAQYKSLGIYKKQDLIGKKLRFNIHEKNNYFQDIPKEYTINEIVDLGTKSIYLPREIINKESGDLENYYEINEVAIYDSTKVTITIGNVPTKVLDKKIPIIVNERYQKKDEENINNGKYLYELGDSTTRIAEFSSLYGYSFEIVGFFENPSGSYNNNIYVAEESYQNLYFIVTSGRSFASDAIYSKTGKAIDDIYIKNQYDEQLKSLELEKGEFINGSLIWLAIIVVITLIMFYFFVRSSLTERMKEISILRALGVKKREVRSIFIVEYAVLTTFSSLIGVVFVAVILRSVYNSSMGDLLDYNATPLGILASIAGIYALNILIALIPVNLFLRKTPAQMLTNYDI